MLKTFKLVPKIDENSNVLSVVCMTGTGETMVIAQMLLPKDGQRNDDVVLADEICSCIRKRMKHSI